MVNLVHEQRHDEFDTAVAAAYGWPADLPEEDILQNLVTLNHQRAAEETRATSATSAPTTKTPRVPKPRRKSF